MVHSSLPWWQLFAGIDRSKGAVEVGLAGRIVARNFGRPDYKSESNARRRNSSLAHPSDPSWREAAILSDSVCICDPSGFEA